MSQAVRQLEPQSVWNHFADLNAVPRPSKKEERVIAFVVDFGNSLGLPTEVDEIGNVLIRKPATAGMEDRPTVILQAHLDMVHQKNNDTVFDFETEGIRMKVVGDWVKAEGTTLGADNGLGVASIMAVLSSSDIEHPALEALFTVDEETGMTGAKELRQNWLKGTILLNLDTEEDDEIGIGCAGGVDVTAKATYAVEPVDGSAGFVITVKGLQGGHSGMDIHKGFGNANKLMNRLLYHLHPQARIARIQGGSLRNAIPRESVAEVWIAEEAVQRARQQFDELVQAIRSEYQQIEPDLEISMVELTSGQDSAVMSREAQTALLRSVAAAHNGVFRMSPGIAGLVETSNNIAKVVVADGQLQIDCLTRSSVESTKVDLANSLTASFELAGYEVTMAGDYPGWAPNMESTILKVLDSTYRERFGEQANIAACHAGLECGILGERYPGLDMISFGPTIHGAHSPDERASISSMQKFWGFFQEILRRIPA